MANAVLPRFSLKTWLILCVIIAINSMVWAAAALGHLWAVCMTLAEGGLVAIWAVMVLMYGAAYALAAFADLFRRKRQIVSPFATADRFSPRQIEPPIDVQ